MVFSSIYKKVMRFFIHGEEGDMVFCSSIYKKVMKIFIHGEEGDMVFFIHL
jgi:hypothetical protein